MKSPAAAVLAFASALAGCAIPEHREAVNYAPEADAGRSIPVCQGAEDCEAKWSAARRWVNAHAAFRIQIYSTDYIETDWSARDDSRELSVRVEREPLGAGRYGIRISAGCRNRAGCVPDAHAAMRDFDGAVAAARVEAGRSAAPVPRPRRRPPAAERPLPPPNF